MNARCLRARIAAWLALSATVLNASWPVLANARPASLAALAEICSTAGPKHVESDAPSQLPDECVRHCALCSLTSERGAALPTHPAPLEHAALEPIRVPSGGDAKCTGGVERSDALPRAPPLFS